MARIDHDRRDLVFDQGLAANGRVEWAHDYLSESATLCLIFGRRSGRCSNALRIGRLLCGDPFAGNDLRSSRGKTRECVLAFRELQDLAEEAPDLLGRLEG